MCHGFYGFRRIVLKKIYKQRHHLTFCLPKRTQNLMVYFLHEGLVSLPLIKKSLGAFGGTFGSLLQQKLPEIYEGDPRKKLLVMRDTEPEPVIFCNLVRLPVVELGNQPNHKTLHLQFFLPAGCTRVMVTQNS